MDKEIKDTYLESLYETLNMCNLVIQNQQCFSKVKVMKAIKLRQDTEECIRKRESIPLDKRL